MYYKITENGVVLDLLNKTKWVKYLSSLNCFVGTDKSSANAIMGSDDNSIYHISGTDYNFSEKIPSVVVEEINKQEYNNLSTQLSLQKQNNTKMEEEISSLKEKLLQQNELLNLLLQKLGGSLE